VADLLTLYGITDEAEREQVLSLARQASTPGWWQQYNDILPRWFELYVGLERAASIIRTYEVQFVPGPLQTEEHARAVILIAAVGRWRPRATPFPEQDDVPGMCGVRRKS